MQFVEQQKQREDRLDTVRAEKEEEFPTDVPVDVQTVLKKLHEYQFDAEVNVSVVLERCGIRSNTFFSRFKHYVGTSPKPYLERLRIRTAMAALRDGCFDI